MSIFVRADGACGTILIRHEERQNALTREMLQQLSQALDDLYQEQSVRAVCITGHGETFTSGIDLHELHSSAEDAAPEQQWFHDVEQQRRLLMQILQYPKPVIAAVNGPALGFGVGIVAASDMVVAAESATFGFPEMRRGLCPGISIPLVAFRLGTSWASQLIMRPKPIEATEAQRIGLAHELVQFDLLWARSAQLANEIAVASPVSLSMTKRLLNETIGEQLATQLTAAAAMVATARTTDHAMEGISAFLEKRQPNWDLPPKSD